MNRILGVYVGVNIRKVIAEYDLDRITVVTLASHSALQLVHGAKKEGFRTALIITENRKLFYEQFKHLIDFFIVVNKWSDLCKEQIVKKLIELNSIFIPHGSFVEYVGLDCAENIEIPLFGLRSIFRVEANQHLKMDLLAKAGIPTPKRYSLGEEINDLVIVKLPGAKGGKGYFLALSKDEIIDGIERAINQGLINKPSDALIQEYVVGVPAYFHFFFSPIFNRLEILGADIRYESNVDGLRRLKHNVLERLGIEPSFIVVGNIPMVLRESLLYKVYDYGLRFVKVTRKVLPPGIIGPFCLEGIIEDDLNIKIFEFSGRIVAGTNLYIQGSPYSFLYWDETMSTGRRIAREIKLAIERGELNSVVT